jgi:GEVED domain
MSILLQQRILLELLGKRQRQLKDAPKNHQALLAYMATSVAWILSIYSDKTYAETMVSVSGFDMETYHVDLGAGQRIKITSNPENGRVSVDQENGVIYYYPDDDGGVDSYGFEVSGDEGTSMMLLLTLMGIGLAAAGIGAAGGGGGGGGGGGAAMGSADSPKPPPDEPVDYGDAPDSFQTLLGSEGPRHSIKPGIYLGNTPPDREENGIPDALANGDDITNTNDEDANDITQLILGTNGGGDPVIFYTVNNTTGEQAYLSFWVDFDGNGVFTADEQILMSVPVNNGPIEIALPADKLQQALDNETLLISRFRLSTDPEAIKTPGGYAPDGEVEDFVLHTVDYGDAPNGGIENINQVNINYQFPVKFSDMGGHHIIREGLYLGDTAPDAEIDGQPSLDSIFDDEKGAAPDDEDANDPTQIHFGIDPDTLMPVLNYSINNTTGEQAYVSLWIDADGNGNWEADEQVANAFMVNDGDISIPVSQMLFDEIIMTVENQFNVYARLRLSTEPTSIATPTGLAPDGEIEDFLLDVDLDFGDAPDDEADDSDYPVLFGSNGGRHFIEENPDLYLGDTAPDQELNGLQSDGAIGDDMDETDDEDANDPMQLNFSYDPVTDMVDINYAINNGTMDQAYLSLWIDINGDGDWDEMSEQIANAMMVSDGAIEIEMNPALYTVMQNTVDRGLDVYARFRLSTDATSIAEPSGYSHDGEIEDFLVNPLIALDYGDAPSGFSDPDLFIFPSIFEVDGARHYINSELYLGNTAPDAEVNGQPSLGAINDDLNGAAPDDEDANDTTQLFLSHDDTDTMGPYFLNYTVNNTTGDPAYVSLWVDWDGTYGFWDGNDQIATQLEVTNGAFQIPIDIAIINSITTLTAAGDDVYARIRVSTDKDSVATEFGFSPDGEVEDFVINPVFQLDFGDAPDDDGVANDYPVLLESEGARHLINPDIYLGTVAPDDEINGLQSANADGDNMDNMNDEQAIATATSYIDGSGNVHLVFDYTNNTGSDSYFSMWIDFGNNSNWTDMGDTIVSGMFVDQIDTEIDVDLGISAVDYNTLISDNTFARIRLSTDQNSVTTTQGLAPDGEVEDFMTDALPDLPVDFGDAFNGEVEVQSVVYLYGYPVLLSHDGARHAMQGDDNPQLGATGPDAEVNGLPSFPSDGDDMDESDDEDANDPMQLDFDSNDFAQPIVEYSIDNDTMRDAYVSFWIDSDASGAWETDERVANAVQVADGPFELIIPDALYNEMIVTMRGNIPVYARFRLSTDETSINDPTGFAPDGEVEDFLVNDYFM